MSDTKTTSRNDQILDDRLRGLTYDQIAERHAISASRARHICNRRAGVSDKPTRTSMLGDRNPQGGFHDR